MRALNLLTPFLLVSLMMGSVAYAQESSDKLSEEEIQQLFQESAKQFERQRDNDEDRDDVAEEDLAESGDEDEFPADADSAEQGADVEIISEQAKQAEYDRPIEGYVRLSDINMVVDVSSKTIREVVDMVVSDAADKTGPWQVKWRLRKEHEFLLREKVNLTAESTFGEFIDHLVDRVNNMTGVRLFVTIFDASRIIVISDTYY